VIFKAADGPRAHSSPVLSKCRGRVYSAFRNWQDESETPARKLILPVAGIGLALQRRVG
jgi:hypothetical protein